MSAHDSAARQKQQKIMQCNCDSVSCYAFMPTRQPGSYGFTRLTVMRRKSCRGEPAQRNRNTTVAKQTWSVLQNMPNNRSEANVECAAEHV
eukprot:scaffold134566_cov17-Tisochrysis_lutea.AAC.1